MGRLYPGDAGGASVNPGTVTQERARAQEWHERTERAYVQPRMYGKAVSVYKLWHMVQAYGGQDAVRRPARH
jgi:hypothetical protein